MGSPFAILTTDLHLTEKQEDQYRFNIFPWLVARYSRSSSVRAVFLLGDLTDRKDNHSAWFVNKVVSCLRDLAGHFDVFILKGNHDFADPNSPFFEFVNHVAIDRVSFYTSPIKISKIYNGGRQFRFLMLPHTKNPDEDWKDLEFVKSDAIFMHQTFKGAKAENGMALDGLSPKRFEKYRAKIFSGDIHVPQKVGPITYIGSPYHIHFGDKFKPRVLIADTDFNTTEEYYPAPRKHTVEVRDPTELKTLKTLREGDWIKVRVLLRRSEFVDWPKYRDAVRKVCEGLGLDLCGTELRELKRVRLKEDDGEPEQIKEKVRHSPYEVFEQYCRSQNIDHHTHDVGKALLGKEPQ